MAALGSKGGFAALGTGMLLTLLTVSSCSTPTRRPSSDAATSAIPSEVISRLGKDELGRVYRDTSVSLETAQLGIASHDGPLTVPIAGVAIEENTVFPVTARQILNIHDLSLFASGKDGATFVYALESGKQAVELQLRNRLDTTLDLRITCDRPISISRRFEKNLKAIRDGDLKIFPHDSNAERVTLRFPSGTLKCEARFRPEGTKLFVAGVQFASDGIFSEMGLAGNLREACIHDAVGPEAGPVSFFSNIHHPSVSCAEPLESVELLTDPFDAFKKKIEALTGGTFPNEAIEKQDFSFPIDFSHAPKFDAILVSAIEFKSDFYGTVIAKILKWHASQGAEVRVIVPRTSTLLFARDLALVNDLEKASPRIRVQLYGDESTKSRFSLNRVQRMIHAKMLVGLSKTQPERQFVIVGGRNIKDTFLYAKAPDYSKYPELEQYGTLLSPFSFFSDLEVLARGDAMSKAVAAQFMSFWNRDGGTMRMRPPNVHIQAGAAQRITGSWGRHILSVPYADERQLESIFVDLIRSARSSLRMASPYFRPTKKIGAALREAAERGVKIQFITELDLMGDNSPPITMSVNQASVNDFFRNVEIYVSRDKRTILHSKVVLVDEDVLFVSATNLNMRSFLHDVENGMLLSDSNVIRQFKDLFDGPYLSDSDRVTDQLKVKFLDRVFIPLVDNYF